MKTSYLYVLSTLWPFITATDCALSLVFTDVKEIFYAVFSVRYELRLKAMKVHFASGKIDSKLRDTDA
jgi:NifB/MoaA-like Fe-S oxidoreductase